MSPHGKAAEVAQDRHASDQRDIGLGKKEHVGRAGQEKAPRRTPTVHGGSHGRELLWRALDFVAGGPLRKIGDEAHRIGPARRQRHVVGEAERE